MAPRFALTALMLGNFITGLAVLAPAGMNLELSRGLAVSVRDVGFLVTAGAVVLCFASPLSAWFTSHIDRRKLLCLTVGVMAIGQLVSAFAPEYWSLMIIRVSMLAVAALYTPQAAGTAALIVPEEKRAGAITYLFLGWSIATAVGVPLINLFAAKVGWRETYGLLALLSAITFALQFLFLPPGLKGAPVSLATWSSLAHNKLIVLLLALNALLVSGQFAILTYMAPLLLNLAGAGPEITSLMFAIFGVSGLVGNLIATRIVGSLGAFKTSVISIGSVLVGLLFWAAGAGIPTVMGVGACLWGLGFASANSMQQARLAAAAPALASASIALNTSMIYVGQAIGSFTGGILISWRLFVETGWTAVGFLLLSLVLLWFTRPGSTANR